MITNLLRFREKFKNLSSKISMTDFIILLIFLQYISLGYIGFFSSFIEVILLLILLYFLYFKYQFKIISILIIFTLIYYINNDQLSKEFFISFKNILIFILVYTYFLKEKYYLFSRIESLLISIILLIPIIGLFANLNTNVASISNHQYANNIFSIANLGLNFHFTTQIILGYYLIFFSYYLRFNSIGNFKFFFSNSKIIICNIFVILFYILLNTSGTSTGVWAFIITIIFLTIFNIIKNRNLFILRLISNLYPLALILLIFMIIDNIIIIDLLSYINNNFFRFGSASFKVIAYQLENIDFFLSLATWFPTFVIDLDYYPKFIYLNSEISLIKHILEYGIFLFAGVIILINRKFSPVALFFTIALIHYSYLFTGIAALLIAKMHNSLFLKK
jgi:hypothetical protein